jgi:hypothetical protein
MLLDTERMYKTWAVEAVIHVAVALLVFSVCVYFFNLSYSWSVFIGFGLSAVFPIPKFDWGEQISVPVVTHYLNSAEAEAIARTCLGTYGLSNEELHKVGVLMYFDWLPYSQICSRALMMGRDGDVKLIKGK